MTARKIDVKTTGGPFNLGQEDRWSKKDVEFLVACGAQINDVGFIHIPLANIEGEVLLGIGQKAPPGSPPILKVGGLRIIKRGYRKFLK